MKCQNCHNEFDRKDLSWTYDCHGIPFHFVCPDCYDKLMNNGYDRFFYTQEDIPERIEPED